MRKQMKSPAAFGACAVGALSLALFTSSLPSLAGAEPGEPTTTGGTAFRRMNESQYGNAIHDIFGPDITIAGRFEPPLRDDGLLAIGSAKVVVTPSGFEQYELRAREIAAQVLSEKKRTATMNCTPKSPAAFDPICGRAFLTKYGRLLFRRPLDKDETAALLDTAQTATKTSGNFYKGMEVALSRLLVAPFFVFRVESTETAPGGKGRRLNSYSLASRLSFLLWDAPPDEALLNAAGRGELWQDAGLQRQVDRMIASPKFEQGVRAYFWDMFGYNQFDGLTKEQTIYKKYSSFMAKDAQEQSLKTIIDHLIRKNADYRDLFTTRDTFLNRRLAAVYKVPIGDAGFDGWAPYRFGAQDDRQGLLSLVGFLMLDPTHEGRSSPTNRGKFVREQLLCQPVPAPPANVNFAIVQDTNNPLFKTARERLKAHQENPVCAGCHAITDPIGLSMENYDAIGQYRTLENGAPIDASGKLNGKPFKDLIGMQTALHDDPSLTSCLVKRVYEYGVGRSVNTGDDAWLEYAEGRFANDGYSLPALMRMIATSRAFSTAPVGTIALNDTKKMQNGGFHGEMVAAKRP